MNCARLKAVVPLASLIALIGGCNSATTSTTTTTGPSPVKCSVSLTPPQNALDAGSGSGSVTIATTTDCAWTASEESSWITGLSPASGQGNGTVQFQVSANAAPAIRQADININGILVRITQSGTLCNVALSSTSQTVDASGGSGTVTVTTPSGCAWTATSGDSWLSISSGATGNGSGTVEFSVAANAGAARAGGMLIGGQAFIVTQSASPVVPCASTIQPTAFSMAASGGNTTVTITVGSGCSWTAASNDTWLAVVGIGAGAGNGAVTISAPANTGTARTGTVTIAGQTFTVTQAGSCAASLNSSTASVALAGATGLSVAVATAAGCAWTASTPATWITIKTGASGSGNGTVTYDVAANSGAARVGTITIAGQAFTVNQAGSCASTLNPASQSVAAAGGAATPVAVTIPATCAWTATTANTWISITSGASGNGSGTVAFTAAANTGPLRTGAIAIAGQTHAVTQASGCTYAINPSTQTIGKNGGTVGPIAVTTAATCPWTAVSNATWITVTAGASGTGNGNVTFTVASNGTDQVRTGTLTIAGRTFTLTQNK